MTNHTPLNGRQVTNAVSRALSGQSAQHRPSAAGALSAALAGEAGTTEQPEEVQRPAPDGTNGATKSFPRGATDPSQGAGGPAKKRRNRDPLLEQIMGLRSMNSRSRF